MKKFFLSIVFVLFLLSAAIAEDAADSASLATGTDLPGAPELATATDLTAEETPVFINRIADPSLSYEFESDDLLHIWFPNIFGADAALISCGGENILIDCATASQGIRVARMLAMVGVDHLDYVLNSHPHNDHILGFETISKSVQVDKLCIGFHEFYTAHMSKITKLCNRNGIPIEHFFDGDSYTVGNAKIDIYMKGDVNWDLNNRSAVMRLTYGERSILFTGDISIEAQKRLMEAVGSDGLKSDILKYPHHMTAMAMEVFLQMVDPDFTVITNTVNYSIKPRHLDLMHIPYAYTSMGYIHLVTDGNVWLAEMLSAEEMLYPNAAVALGEDQTVEEYVVQEE